MITDNDASGKAAVPITQRDASGAAVTDPAGNGPTVHRQHPFNQFSGLKITGVTVQPEQVSNGSRSLSIRAVHQGKIIKVQVVNHSPTDLALSRGGTG